MPDSSQDRIRGHPDEVLLQMVARRSVEAFEVLYDRHAQVMHNLILRIVRRADAAEELLHEVFWKVWQNAGQYRGTGAAAAWMYRIARHRALELLRRETSRPHTAETPWDEAPYFSRHPGAEAETGIETEANARRRLVLDALAALPEEQRQCLELAYFEGKSRREIAATTQTAPDAITSRMRIGLEKLERQLRNSGYREERAP